MVEIIDGCLEIDVITEANNRGMMLSLLSLGVGAATTYGMTRGRANRMTQITEQPILISNINF